MKIEDIEKQTGLNAKTIRYYESRGLIQVTRCENQYRSCDSETVERLCQIKQMRELGISLADIRLWCDKVVTSEELLRKRLQSLDDDNKKSRNTRRLCEEFLENGFSASQNAGAEPFEERFQEPETASDDGLSSDVPLFLGIDIGTTSLSAQVLASDTGRCVQTYSFDHNSAVSIDGYPDAYAADAERLVERAAALTASLSRTYPEIVSIGITGQMHGIVCLDENNRILSPLYTWQNEFGLRQLSDTDTRTVCQAIADRCGEAFPTGYGLVTYYALREFGLLPGNTAKIATIMDVLAGHLCETSPLIHPTNAASLGAYDLIRNEFRQDILDKLDIPRSIFPDVSRDYAVVGTYAAAGRNIPVSAAIGDNQAGVFGSLAGENMVLLNVGTSSQVSMICDTPDRSGGEVRPYFDGKYIVLGAALCGGRAYAVLCSLVRSIAGAFGQEVSSRAVYEYLNQAAESAGDTGLTVATQFCGTRTDPSVRGSISNIDLHNFTPAALSSGILHGIIEELYDMYTAIRTDESETELVVSGNAMRRNPVLRKICGDRLGKTPEMPVHTEEAAFGAALYGAIAGGQLTRAESYRRIQYQIQNI